MNKNSSFWRSALHQLRHTKTLAISGLLCAIGIVLKALTISLTQLLRISLVFLSSAIGGFIYGPFVAGLIGIIIDLVGFFISSSGGAYSPAFTFVAFVGGFIYGCWLYKKPVKLWRTFCAHLTHTIVISFLLNPFFLSLFYGNKFWGLVLVRIPINLIILPLGTFLIFSLQKALQPQLSNLRKE